MNTPTLGDAHLRLHSLAGQWGGEERVHAGPGDPAGGAASAFVNNRVVLDGFAVLQEYERYREGRSTYTGHGVFWWDEDAHQYVMTWFDSLSGTPSDFRGGFDGDVLQLVHERSQGGFARCSFDYGSAGEYVFTMEESPDGETWLTAIEGAYGLLHGPTPQERKKRVARKVQAAATTRGLKKTAKKTAKRTAKKVAKQAARKTAKKATTKKATALRRR